MSIRRYRPWMKFEPDRWQGDEALRMCAATARGVWIEIMCIMHKAEPYGHLLIRGKQPTDRQLAVITGLSPLELSESLAELEENEVFSRTDDGTIFSRGMVRDEEIHIRSVNGGKTTQANKRKRLNGKRHPSRGSSSTPSDLEPEPEPEPKKESEEFDRAVNKRANPATAGGPRSFGDIANDLFEAMARTSTPMPRA